MSFKATILDRYIIRKFVSTYIFALLIFIVIVVIFDISEKIDDFVEKGATFKSIVVDYYGNFIPYFMNMFNPLFVFIAVIFFTSKMAHHGEITAMLAGGISFKRLLQPYFKVATVIALFSLILNLFVIPPANKKRLEFTEKYIKDKYINTDRDIHLQLSPGTYLYMESFNSWSNTANRFTLESIEGHSIVSKLSADMARWDSLKQGWRLHNYVHRKHGPQGFVTTHGKSLDTVINLTLNDLNKRDNIVESYNHAELNELIDLLKMRGDKKVIFAQIEKQNRFTLPFSAFVLTLMGVALSAKKKKGGIGINIGVGLMLSFTYILSLRFSQMFVHAGTLPVWIALWLPNLLFAIVAYILYRVAPK